MIKLKMSWKIALQLDWNNEQAQQMFSYGIL
jgi:hypothetical protein